MTCAVGGCGRALRRDNRSGYCCRCIQKMRAFTPEQRERRRASQRDWEWACPERRAKRAAYSRAYLRVYNKLRRARAADEKSAFMLSGAELSRQVVGNVPRALPPGY